MSDNQWKTCCHEAGHAILCVKLEVVFDCVRIGPDEDDGVVDLTSTPIDDPDDDWTTEMLENYRTIYAAGAAAERLVFGSAREYGTKCDRKCHAKIETMLSEGRSNGFDTDVHKAMSLVTRKEIERVAATLQSTKRLTFEDVSKLLGVPLPWTTDIR